MGKSEIEIEGESDCESESDGERERARAIVGRERERERDESEEDAGHREICDGHQPGTRGICDQARCCSDPDRRLDRRPRCPSMSCTRSITGGGMRQLFYSIRAGKHHSTSRLASCDISLLVIARSNVLTYRMIIPYS